MGTTSSAVPWAMSPGRGLNGGSSSWNSAPLMTTMPAIGCRVRKPQSSDINAPCEKPPRTTLPGGGAKRATAASMSSRSNLRDSAIEAGVGGQPSNPLQPSQYPRIGSQAVAAVGERKPQPPTRDPPQPPQAL